MDDGWTDGGRDEWMDVKTCFYQKPTYTQNMRKKQHMCTCISVYTNISIYLPAYLPTYPSIYPKVNLSIYLSVDPIDDTKPALP